MIVSVVDYGVCNLDSVLRAVEKCGGQVRAIKNAEALLDAECIILPGVGSFGAAKQKLDKAGFSEAIIDCVENAGIPILGICLGMQLLLRRSHEDGEHEGLGLIEGEVVRLQSRTSEERIPHIGWNEIHPVGNSPLFTKIPAGTDCYFVHSYHVVCDNKYVAARTPYCGGFISSVYKDHIMGAQFHPEKSQKAGMQILDNFLRAAAA